MKKALLTSVTTTGHPMPERPPSARECVFDAARHLFSECGFHGTYLRDVCQRARVNLAAVYCHFHSKELLYQSVRQEACRQLAVLAYNFKEQADTPPEKKLRGIVESLFERLGGERVWIAKLLARELVSPVAGMPALVGAGLGRDYESLQAVIRDLLGRQANPETVRLSALSVVSQCVFYCLAAEAIPQIPAQLFQPLPGRKDLARHVAGFSLEALKSGRRKRNHEFNRCR
jgi:TetR/AcrR family transcriptional regulator, regulator of cefoperazone and chloramphenicol sensitivity